jgi:hypothetical protein
MQKNDLQAEVYLEPRKCLSCMVHGDLRSLGLQVARQKRWSLSRTTDEILLHGFRVTGHLPEESRTARSAMLMGEVLVLEGEKLFTF